MEGQFYRKEKTRPGLRELAKKLLKNKRALLGLIVGLPLLLFLVFGGHGILQRMRLQNQKAELEAKIRQTEAENRTLQAQANALDGDKKAIEKVAREKYGMIREGETVYKVKKDK
jgi:cell division protein FtsB